MNWMLFAQIVAREGLPLALELFNKWSTSRDLPITATEIAELQNLASKTSNSQMLEALARAGIDPESEQGKKLLGLI